MTSESNPEPPNVNPQLRLVSNRTETRRNLVRVWLVQQGSPTTELARLLEVLAAQPEAGVTFLGPTPTLPEGAAELLVLGEGCGPQEPTTEHCWKSGLGLVVVTTVEAAPHWLSLPPEVPLVLLPGPTGPEALLLGLWTAEAARRRLLAAKKQLEQLQHRLDDRIVIERAKGILVQRFNIPEEEAYKRLRMLSRRQRRPIRDISQSVLDTQSLLEAGGGSLFNEVGSDPRRAGTRGKGPSLNKLDSSERLG
jgi:hypothetical protein